MFSRLKAFIDKSATTNTEGVSEVLKPSPIKERAENSTVKDLENSTVKYLENSPLKDFTTPPPREPQSEVGNEPDKFAAPVVKLTWDEIYARVSIILATVQPVKYHHVLGTGRRGDPLTIELSTEEPAVFGTWLKSGKDCMAIDKDGVVHWFRHNVKAGTLSYGTTFGCDYT